MTLELNDVALRVGADEHIYATNLKLEAGEFNTLLGTTLSGKTTLMRLMAGLDRPTGGRVQFNGEDVTGRSVQQRDVAMVYQQFINYPNFTVFDNIASPLKLQGKSASEIKKAVGDVADLLKLSPMLDRQPSELSGGQQQRTALARALVKKASLVLLDEPLANLDYKLREELREELPRLFEDSGSVVVYATTEPSEALLLGGRTAALHEGRVTQFGATGEVYRQPGSLLTARVFSDPPINVASISKSADTLVLDTETRWQASAMQAALPDGDYELGIRPHHLSLSETDQQSASVDGTVVLTELTGSESTIHAQVGDDTWIAQSSGIHPLEPGSPVRFFIDLSSCLMFRPDGELVT